MTAPTLPREDYPSALRAWATVLLLFAASIVSVIDRGLLYIVVDGVKADLHITDVQVSLLQGLAFGIFYAVMGVWLGLVADRFSRRALIMAGIAVWSIATVGGGLAASFGELFAARLLVGLGEAALAPAAISMIADLFPAGRRGRAIGFYLMGQSVATGLSILIAGGLLGAAARGDFATWPVLATLTPWRVVFVLCGLLGVVVAAAFLLTREPVRRGAPIQQESLREQVRATLAHFWNERAKFVSVYLAFAVFFLGTYGAIAWQVVMLSRKFGVTPTAVSPILGPMSIGFGLAGPLLGGWLVDRIVRRRGNAAILRLLAILPLAAVPSACGVLAPTLFAACLLCAMQGGITAMVGAATFSYLQGEVPATMRGISISITGLMNTLVGAALGPVLVALLTEDVFADTALVGWSIFCVAPPAYLLSALLFWRAAAAANSGVSR